MLKYYFLLIYLFKSYKSYNVYIWLIYILSFYSYFYLEDIKKIAINYEKLCFKELIPLIFKKIDIILIFWLKS